LEERRDGLKEVGEVKRDGLKQVTVGGKAGWIKTCQGE